MNRVFVLTCLIVLGVACDDDDDPVDVEPMGILAVDVTTSGETVDPDGYSVEVDGLVVSTVDVTSSTTMDLAVGDHEVALGDLAENCAVQGDGSVTASITEAVTTTVAFVVACS